MSLPKIKTNYILRNIKKLKYTIYDNFIYVAYKKHYLKCEIGGYFLNCVKDFKRS